MDSEHSVSRTVCFLNRGESFGELGLISNAPRQASVISKEPVELLVFSDEVTSRTRVTCTCVRGDVTSVCHHASACLVYVFMHHQVPYDLMESFTSSSVMTTVSAREHR